MVMKFYDQYEAIQDKDDRIETLENNQKRRKKYSRGVYIIETADMSGYYKVGKSEDGTKRNSQYNINYADHTDYDYYFETDYPDELEKCVHGVLDSFRYRAVGNKEVFKYPLYELKYTIIECNELLEKMFIIKIKLMSRKNQSQKKFY